MKLKRELMAKVLLMVVLIIFSLSVHGYQTILQPDSAAGKDSSLKQSGGSASTNFGTATTITLDTESGSAERGILEFDFSTLPAKADILSAILELNLSSATGSTFNGTLYRVNNSWTETGVSWNNRSNSNSWDSAGGDYDNTTVHAKRELNNTVEWKNWTITYLVKGWFNGTWSNLGMIIVAEPSQGGNSLKSFDSSDSVTAGLRPRLTINYTLPPNVTGLIPALNSNFNTSQTIEIAANVTHDVGVSKVFANITRPGGTIDRLELTLALNNKYNSSYTIPAVGAYNITFIANDTRNNINATEKTNFTATTPPNVTNLIPVIGSSFTTDNAIEIAANVINTIAIDKVLANITRPGGTIDQIILSLALGTKYNSSYIIPVDGTYTVRYIANDTSNNINSTETTSFSSTTPSSGGGNPNGGGGGGGGGSSTKKPTAVTNTTIVPPIEIPLPPSSLPLPEPAAINASLASIIDTVTSEELNVIFSITATADLHQASITYNLISPDGTAIYEQTETLSLDQHLEFAKSFDLSAFAAGEYRLVAWLSYAGQQQEARTEQQFTVEKAGNSEASNPITGATIFDKLADKLAIRGSFFSLLLLLLILVAGGYITYSYWYHQPEKQKKSIKGITETKEKKEIKKTDDALEMPKSKVKKSSQVLEENIAARPASLHKPVSSLIVVSGEKLHQHIRKKVYAYKDLPCVYVSLNKPQKMIKTLLKRKVDENKLYLIDCVSESKVGKDIISVPADRLDLILTGISAFIKTIGGPKLLVIDTLSALVTYNDEHQVAQFVGKLTAAASQHEATTFAFSARNEETKALEKETFNFFDRVEKR